MNLARIEMLAPFSALAKGFLRGVKTSRIATT
jgi:hypothetical protein